MSCATKNITRLIQDSYRSPLIKYNTDISADTFTLYVYSEFGGIEKTSEVGLFSDENTVYFPEFELPKGNYKYEIIRTHNGKDKLILSGKYIVTDNPGSCTCESSDTANFTDNQGDEVYEFEYTEVVVSGIPGSDGKSAYEVAVESGFVGTESEWLESLRGQDGYVGEDGLSSYQIWLNAGNTGDVSVYLASLKGEKGDTGSQGPQGPQGIPGTGGGDSALVPTTNGKFTVRDPYGNVGYELSADGSLEVPKFSQATKDRIIAFVEDASGEKATTTSKPSLDKYADINHIITYGQSLSVGQTEVVITTSALFPNLVNFDGVTRTSPYDLSTGGSVYPTNRRLSFVPITERVNDGTSPGILRETPTSGTLESLALEINKFSPVTFPTLPMKLLGSAPGWGATTIAQLSKGTAYYTQLIADVTAGKALTNASDKVYKVLSITMTQGESDYGSSTSSIAYEASMIQFKTDVNNDIKAITGQTDDIIIVMYQTATSNGGGKTYPNIALSQYKLAMNNPGFYMATAMYQFKYNDGFHLKSESSKLLGAYYGLAISRIISEKIDWKPLHPKSYQIQGNLCKVKFEVPKAPLQFKAANTVTLTNKGFAVIKNTVNILTSVTLGDDGVSVNLKCSESPVGALIQYGVNTTLTPGGTASSIVNMGNLCDSQGVTQKFNILGTDLSMDNWSPIFEYQI